MKQIIENSLSKKINAIIELFNKNIKNTEIFIENSKHCGADGHWLEQQMKLKPNCKNEPDIDGFEMKKMSKKITLGDFSASEYAYSRKNKRNTINAFNEWSDDVTMTRTDFIHFFGNSNQNKNGRYSWSGSCVPTYDKWNDNGQNLLVMENNDIVILYSFSKDTRKTKANFPEFLKHDCIAIALWKMEKMKAHVENKFNQNGFFMCEKIGKNYDKIHFGRPFTFDYFIECIKSRKIFFDSGMYEGNNRNYSHFRAMKNFWLELVEASS